MDDTVKDTEENKNTTAQAKPVSPTSESTTKQQTVSEIIGPDLSGLMDVKMVISIEVGRTKIKLNELMNLSKGAIVELDKVAGEPLNILVNGKLIAYGEVVSINGKYGVRITELASKNESMD